MTSEDAITTFVDHYCETRHFWERAAVNAEQQFKNGLAQSGIRQITTHRTKDPERLRAKLLKRQAQDPGKHFPRKEDDTQELLVNGGMEYNAESTQVYHREFEGYRADHYRVHLRDLELNLDGVLQRKLVDARIEIQVATLLMHAWAEVYHDLGYKPTDGLVSLDEHRLLDGINGLVSAGELFLKQLQRGGQRRITNTEQRFANHYELGAFVQKSLFPAFVVGPMDVVFTVLKGLGMDSPKALGPALTGWVQHSTDPSDVLGLLHHIFFKRVTTNGTKSDNWKVRDIQDKVGKGTSTEDDELKQKILFSAVDLYDALSQRMGQPPVLQKAGASPGLGRFQTLYSIIGRRWPGEDEAAEKNKAVEELWAWFEDNQDLKSKVSFGIAALQMQSIMDEIVQPRTTPREAWKAAPYPDLSVPVPQMRTEAPATAYPGASRRLSVALENGTGFASHLQEYQRQSSRSQLNEGKD
ncbi:hypothetical protein IFM51744_04967 [Aspergillus udagawae]|nr:hypothetical protein IFM51744_04967 [Aspergillus udagawae]